MHSNVLSENKVRPACPRREMLRQGKKGRERKCSSLPGTERGWPSDARCFNALHQILNELISCSILSTRFLVLSAHSLPLARCEPPTPLVASARAFRDA